MKLEQLATLLKKDAAELEGTLRLQKTDDVPDDVLVKEFESSLKLAAISALSEGKKQGEGKAKREVMTEVEKILRSKFEVEGDNLDSIIENLTGKVGKVEYKADEKVIKERDVYKAKFEAVNATLESKIKEFEKIETQTKVRNKILPIAEKYEFVTDKVREIAVNSFLDSDFLISDNEIFIMQDGKPVASFEQFAEAHFNDFGKVKGGKPTLPPNFIPKGTSYGTSQKELMEALRKATTAEERAAIQEQLKKFD